MSCVLVFCICITTCLWCAVPGRTTIRSRIWGYVEFPEEGLPQSIAPSKVEKPYGFNAAEAGQWQNRSIEGLDGFRGSSCSGDLAPLAQGVYIACTRDATRGNGRSASVPSSTKSKVGFLY